MCKLDSSECEGLGHVVAKIQADDARLDGDGAMDRQPYRFGFLADRIACPG